MSTRSTIFFSQKSGFHVYKSVITENVCIETHPLWELQEYGYLANAPEFRDGDYNDFTMPKEQWIELAKNILEHFKNDD